MKYFFTIFTCIFFLTGCSSVPAQIENNIPYHTQTESIDTLENTTTQKQLYTEIPSPHNRTIPHISNSATTTSIDIEKPQEIISIIIDGKNYLLPYSENQSVYDAMTTLTTLPSSEGFSFQAKKYSGLGFFVYEINGKKQDNKTGLYWIYYINNQSANIGISHYIIQKGDIIEWKYEKSTF